MSDNMTKETTKAEEKVDAISQLFHERDRPLPKEDPLASSGVLVETISDSVPSKLPKGDVKNKSDEDDRLINNKDFNFLQAELSKAQKTIAENQKYGRQNAQRLKSALKQAKMLVENGVLSEEESKELIASLDSDIQEDMEVATIRGRPFDKILHIANTELENLRKYSDDALLDDKIKAFDYFLSLASKEEVEKACEDLEGLVNDPIKLVKKMLSIGKGYYDEFYKDIADAGGVQNYLKQKNEEIEKYQTTIDKLSKRLSQYEDYDQPRHRINEVGESKDAPPTKRDSIEDLFHDRERDDIRRQKRLA